MYTNPESDTIITHWDRVFVLGVDIQNDLRLEFKPIQLMKEKQAEEIWLEVFSPGDDSVIVSPNNLQVQANNTIGSPMKRLNSKFKR